FVRLDTTNEDFDSWKVWERGAPHLAVELVSYADKGQEPWKKKFAKYRRLGVKELVRFDPEGKHTPLEIWDEDEGELIPRVLTEPKQADCRLLDLAWVVVEHPVFRLVLRLAEKETLKLLPTPDELVAQAEEELYRVGRDRDRVAQERDRAAEER